MPLEQAPGITFGVSEAGLLMCGRLGRKAAGRTGAGFAPRMIESGTTDLTAGLALSLATSPLDTVAAKELTSR